MSEHLTLNKTEVTEMNRILESLLEEEQKYELTQASTFTLQHVSLHVDRCVLVWSFCFQTTFDQDDVFLGLVVDVYDGEATAKVSHAQEDHPEKGTIEDGVAFRRFFAPTA